MCWHGCYGCLGIIHDPSYLLIPVLSSTLTGCDVMLQLRVADSTRQLRETGVVKVLLRLLGISDDDGYLFTPTFSDLLIGCDAALADC